jgi:hypothetical protein
MISASALSVTRRTACAGIAAASTLAPFAASAREAAGASMKPRLILCDTTLGGSAALAERWQRDAGCEIAFFAADVTPLWQRRFHRAWNTQTPALGGITSKETLFCLERLAWDAGQRVLVRTSLADRSGATLWRWLIAPRPARMEGPA